MLTIHFPKRSKGLLSVSVEVIGLSHRRKIKILSAARDARTMTFGKGIPERKVPVIGNLSLPIFPSLFSLAVIHSQCEAAETAIDNSLTPRGKIGYESPARFSQRWKGPARNLIRERDKHNKKKKN